MSKTVEQIYAINPTTVVADTDLYYLVQSPYTPGADAAISGLSLKAAFGGGGTINPGLANQIAYYASSGSSISGLTSGNNGVLITSGAGVPSISSTLPTAVQGNITSLGTIASGVWNGSVISGTYGGTGVNNGASTITVGGNFAMSGGFSFTGTLTGITTVTFPTSGTLATTSQIPTGAALTKTDDTNVTLTLGGSPNTALVNAASLTLGWTGSLAETRGGTNQTSYTLGDTLYASAANTLSKLAGNTTSGIKYLSQTGTGAVSAAPAWATISGGDITGAALTKTDDTNVTLTLGGAPTTALLRASSLTLGWTGTLSGTRGGTGVNNGASTITIGGNFAMSGAFAFTGTLTNTTTVTFPTSGTLATTSQLLTSPLTTKGDIWVWSTTNDRLPVATGDGKILQVSSGAATGLAYSTATYPSTATNAGRILREDGTNWVQTTSTFADTYAASTVLYANGSNNVAGLTTANNGLLVTSSAGIPSILAGPGTTGNMLLSNAAAAPSFSTSTIPSSAGATANKHLISDGTNYVLSTPTFPNSASSTGTILRADGTNWVATTSTYPNTNAVSTLLYASSANVMAALATTNSAFLRTDGSGVPNWNTSIPVNSINVQIFSSTGAFTYTPTSGMRFIKVTMLGAGGGSGAAEGTIAQTAASAPGNGGGYLVFYMTAAQIGASKTGSIGTGGAGGTVPSNNGTAGGATVFADWTAAGGEGGLGCAAAATSQTKQTTGSTGNTSGTGTALYNRPTILGFISYTTTTTLANAGASAGNFLGTGAYGAVLLATSNNIGGSGLNGQGGGGSVTFNTNTDQAGAPGGNGYVSVEEYLSV